MCPIITKNCFRETEYSNFVETSIKYSKTIFIHDVKNCTFPDNNKPPFPIDLFSLNILPLSESTAHWGRIVKQVQLQEVTIFQ